MSYFCGVRLLAWFVNKLNTVNTSKRCAVPFEQAEPIVLVLLLAMGPFFQWFVDSMSQFASCKPFYLSVLKDSMDR